MEVSALKHAGVVGLHGRSPLLRLQGDERLIALVRRGNQHAFEALVSRYQARLLAFCRHMLGSREDAEDVLQEVFAAAFNAILADERPINVRPWLYRIARNRSLNHLRKAQAIGVDSMDVHLSEHGLTTADQVHRREEFRLLMSDVGELPETQRTALLLREIDALSYEQIAEAMETTVPSVKSLLVRARVSLAEAAEARLLTCEDVREELGEVAEGLRRTSAPVRRHLRACERCQLFRKQLRHTNRALAAVLPVGPLILFKKTLLAHLGTAAGAGAGASAGGSAAAGGGATAAAGAAGAAGVTVGGIVQAGAGALATKAVAGIAAAAIVTAGAVEVKHVTRRTAAENVAPAAVAPAAHTAHAPAAPAAVAAPALPAHPPAAEADRTERTAKLDAKEAPEKEAAAKEDGKDAEAAAAGEATTGEVEPIAEPASVAPPAAAAPPAAVEQHEGDTVYLPTGEPYPVDPHASAVLQPASPPRPAPAPTPAPAPAAEPAPAAAPAPAPAPEPAPAPPPAAQPAPPPAAEPAPPPAAEPAPPPVSEPAPAPSPEAAPEPTPTPAPAEPAAPALEPAAAAETP